MVISSLLRAFAIGFLLSSRLLWVACSAPLNAPSPAVNDVLLSPTPGMLTPKPSLTAPILAATPTLTPEPVEADPPRYVLEAELDYRRHFLRVQQTITQINPSAQPLSELLLMVEPNRYLGTFTLKSLSVAGQDSKGKEEWVEINQLRLPLPQPWQPMEKLEVRLEYELNLPSPQPNPATRPVPFGWTALQTNLVDWYPFIPPYREGKGWLAHPPGFFGEHLVSESADYAVTIRIRDSLTVRTTASPNPTGEPMAGQLTLAASAPAEERDGTFYFSLSKGRSFAWSVSHLYTVSTAQVGGVTLYGYAFPAHRAAGEAALATTAQAVELFARLFGAYPHPTLSVVEADFLDGMEYDGLLFLSKGFYNLYQGSPTEYLVAIAAHEAAHQWWYALVGNDQALEPWLDEALCTYMEKLYYENFAPEALPWWWTYRIDFYQPSGWINGSIYDYTAFPNAYEAYRNAVYLNGAKFLEDVRQSLGDEAFFAFLRRYAEANHKRIATGEDFLELLKDSSSQDLNPILQKYLR
ncbi:MAG: M1 family metallopeptidase [Anaerolineales bacterium]|nr:M1 family metallopeptidase [Anaerolineales bacterium]